MYVLHNHIIKFEIIYIRFQLNGLKRRVSDLRAFSFVERVRNVQV